MSIELKPNSNSEDIRKAFEKLNSSPQAFAGKNLQMHFGKLKRGIDGLDFQMKARNEWS